MMIKIESMIIRDSTVDIPRDGSGVRPWRLSAALACVLMWLCAVLSEAAPDGVAAETTSPQRSSVSGLDVSGHQGVVDWQHWWNQGMRFAYVKATEGTNFRNADFVHQYDGASNVGMLRGAYHYALPDRSSGAEQANYFVDHGGGWSGDGNTLPGALDLEYNPYGSTCYAKSPQQMGAWVRDFSETYKQRTGRYPVIYTNTAWWNQCVGGEYVGSNPLWIARYSDQVGELPPGWNRHTIWQHSSNPIDQNRFNGSLEQLRAFATG